MQLAAALLRQCFFICVVVSTPGAAQPPPATGHCIHSAEARAISDAAGDGSELRDGSRDFDFEIGAWKTHVKRLAHPLTGSSTWLDYDGTTTVTPVWEGRANLVQLEVSGAGGKIEALSLRLYNPETRQWSLNFSNSASGTIGVPTIGEFRNGRGEFYDRETLGTRPILVRFRITPRDANTVDFEQSFSADEGKTWEPNWLATDTRIPEQR